MEIDQIKRILEAAIMAAGSPLSRQQLLDLFAESDPHAGDSIDAALELLTADYAEHAVALVEVASGWRFQVRPEYQPFISNLWTERQTRYTRALLETLALIAYRQPVTRGEIEQIRGVAVSANIVKTLEEREWIRVIGHRDVPGRPALFGTTRQFLDYFGLKNLDQLPPLADLRDIGELEPELLFQPPATPVVGIEPSASETPDDDTALAEVGNDDAPDQRDQASASVEADTPPSTHSNDHSSIETTDSAAPQSVESEVNP